MKIALTLASISQKLEQQQTLNFTSCCQWNGANMVQKSKVCCSRKRSYSSSKKTNFINIWWSIYVLLVAQKSWFFQSVLVHCWRLSIQRMVSITFLVLKIFTFFVFTRATASNFSQFFCEVIKNYPRESSKHLLFIEKCF